MMAWANISLPYIWAVLFMHGELDAGRKIATIRASEKNRISGKEVEYIAQPLFISKQRS